MKAAKHIHKTIPRFTKPRFFFIYEQLLYMEINDIEPPKKSKDKKIKTKVFTIKEPYVSYWPNIIHAFKQTDHRFNSEYNNASILMSNYIQLHIKRNVIPKLYQCSSQLKRSIDYIIRIHLKLCWYEMEHKHLPNYKSKDSIAYADEEEEELKRKNNIVNLFIGDFDLKKFLENEQKIQMKKGEYCNTFIFSNHNNEQNNNTKKKKQFVFGKLLSPQKRNKRHNNKQSRYMQTHSHLYCTTSRYHQSIQTNRTISILNKKKNKSNQNNLINKQIVQKEKKDTSKERFEMVVPQKRYYHSHKNSEEIHCLYTTRTHKRTLRPLLTSCNSNSNNNYYDNTKCKTQNKDNDYIKGKGNVIVFPKIEHTGSVTVRNAKSNRVILPYKVKNILDNDNYISKKDLYY